MKHINKISKSKYLNNQISFRMLQKRHVILLNKNIKLKELLRGGRGGEGGSEKNRKINKLPPSRLLGT